MNFKWTNGRISKNQYICIGIYECGFVRTTLKPAIEIPENESDIKDFIGWIADGGDGPNAGEGYSSPF